LVGADALHQVDAVVHDVARLVVVTGGALFVDIERVEAQLRISPDRPVVAGVPLALVVTAAADARQITVPLADPLVECGLCLAQIVALGLDPLPCCSAGCPFLPVLFTRLPGLGGLCQRDGARDAASGLQRAGRDELGSACGVAAFLGPGLLGGGQGHAAASPSRSPKNTPRPVNSSAMRSV